MDKHPLDSHFALAVNDEMNHNSVLLLTSGKQITGVVTEYFPDHRQIHIAERSNPGFLQDWIIDVNHVIGIRWE